MEVNRLNPTKSIRIGGISHFAFVNGWLLRSWGRSCIAGDASKARLRSCRLAVAVGTHRGRGRCDLLQFVEKAVLRKRKGPHCWGPEGARGFRSGHVAGFTRLYWVPAVADLISAVRGHRWLMAALRFRIPPRPNCAGSQVEFRSSRSGFHATALSLWQRWDSRDLAGLPPCDGTHPATAAASARLAPLPPP